MSKKHYCKNCQNLIEEGKEIKVRKGTNYRSSRYSSCPRDYYVYYLFPKCFQQQQEETRARNERGWKQVGLTLLIVLLVLMAGIVFFFFISQRDKKLDKITKKAQRK